MVKTTNNASGLSAVKGVGPARIKKLNKIGISTINDLAAATPDKLKQAGFSAGTAKKVIASAAQRTPQKTTKKTAKKSRKKTTKKAVKKRSAPTTQAQANATKAAANAMKDIIARARDHFRKAPQEHVFYVVDGRTIQDLRELAEALEDMAEQVFSHHVNHERHDFANWVHEVLQERALAEQLREANKHPEHHQRVIYRHIVRRAW